MFVRAVLLALKEGADGAFLDELNVYCARFRSECDGVSDVLQEL